MARDLNTGTNRLDAGDVTFMDGATSLSVFFRFNLDATGDGRVITKWGSNIATEQSMLVTIADNDEILFGVGDGSARQVKKTSSASLSTGTWYGITCIWGGGSTITIYKDASNESLTSVVAGSPSAILNAPTALQIGHESNEVFNSANCKIAEIAIWPNTSLSAAQAAQLAAGFSPLFIRPLPAFYAPLIGGSGNDRDLINGSTLTLTGTVGAADHPRVFYPAAPYRIVAPMPPGETNSGESPGEIEWHASEYTTNQSRTSSTYASVAFPAISNLLLTEGKQYLILVTAHCRNATSGALVKVRTIHGSTAFAESEMIHESTSPEWAIYQYFTVWTAVGGEDVTVQWANGGTGTVHIDQISILMMNLTDDVTENTDWFYDGTSSAATTDVGLSTTPTDGASITFTPSGASDWLVLSHAQIDVGATLTTQAQSFIARSGEATSSVPQCGFEPGNTSEVQAYMMMRVFSCTAASNTFTEKSQMNSGTTHTRLNSKIFALKLNAFEHYAFDDNPGDYDSGGGAGISATNYASNVATVSITPTTEGRLGVIAYMGGARKNTAREIEFRVQVDDSDQPPSQTTDNYQFDMGTDAIDVFPITMVTIPSVNTAAHTIDLDASSDSTTGTPTVNHPSLVVWTMALAAGAGGGTTRHFFTLLGVGA